MSAVKVCCSVERPVMRGKPFTSRGPCCRAACSRSPSATDSGEAGICMLSAQQHTALFFEGSPRRSPASICVHARLLLCSSTSGLPFVHATCEDRLCLLGAGQHTAVTAAHSRHLRMHICFILRQLGNPASTPYNVTRREQRQVHDNTRLLKVSLSLSSHHGAACYCCHGIHHLITLLSIYKALSLAPWVPKGLLRALPLLRALTDLLCPAGSIGLAAPRATGVVDSLSLISCPRLL